MATVGATAVANNGRCAGDPSPRVHDDRAATSRAHPINRRLTTSCNPLPADSRHRPGDVRHPAAPRCAGCAASRPADGDETSGQRWWAQLGSNQQPLASEKLQEHDFTRRLEALVRVGPKYGIVVTTATHSLLVPDYRSSTLRSYLGARNRFAFRNQNKSETSTIDGVQVAPSSLPEGGGYAYKIGGGRLAMLRAAWSDDMDAHAAGLPRTTLDPDTALALAPWRPTAEQDPTQAARRAQLGLGQWRSTRATQPQAALTLDAPEKPQHPTRVGELVAQIPAALTAANVIPIRPQSQRAGDGLSPNQAAVLAALRDGCTRTGDIAQRARWLPRRHPRSWPCSPSRAA